MTVRLFSVYIQRLRMTNKNDRRRFLLEKCTECKEVNCDDDIG